MELAIEFREVTKKFSNINVIDGLSFSISQGTLYVLLGANGAGKTTALRMLAGLSPLNSGEIFILGKDIAKAPLEVKQITAFLPDEPMIYDLLKPIEYLEFISGLWGVPRDVAMARAESLLSSLELWSHKEKMVKSFSRGMKQKLALAGALIHDPQIIILDEPLTGLDALAAKQVKDILRAQLNRGTSIILTTHILEVAERIADKIGILSNGKIVAEGSIEELRHQFGASLNLEEIFISLVNRNK